jgi:hypothetical protein
VSLKLLEKLSWIEIKSQNDMDRLFNEIYSFNDGMLKEFHIINRGYVNSDLSKSMSYSFDGILLLRLNGNQGLLIY